MKRRSYPARALLLIAVLAATQWLAAAPAATEPRYVAGEILVRYRPDVTQSEIASIHAASRVRVLEVVEALGIYRLALPAGRSTAAMMGEFSADPRCERVEPNYIGEGGDYIPNDTAFDQLWHLDNSGQSGGTPDADIDASRGWELTRGSNSVIVAVLDTGIDSDHPEFQGRILPGFDFVNEDADPEADHAHGAHVSGILAANADNLFATAGVDHFAKILPVKVLNSLNRGSVMDLIEGILFAVEQGAHVINLSLIDYPVGSSFLENALQSARDAGAILIACAGNGGIGDADVSGPGASPLTISVGASTRTDDRAPLSATGSALDLVAPGLSIRTVAYDTDADTTTSFSGCSAATPVVSGIVTLLLSQNPSLTHDQVQTLLTQTAEDLVGPKSEDTPGRDDFFGHGRVNMYHALLLELSMPMPATPNWVLVLLGALLLLCAGLFLMPPSPGPPPNDRSA